MGLPKGKTNNCKGRPKGSMNLVNRDLREMIGEILAGKFENIDMLLEKLDPRDQMKFILELLSYALPKLEPVTLESTIPPWERASSFIEEINRHLTVRNDNENGDKNELNRSEEDSSIKQNW